ncbi:MAG TPA: response regulator [Vicinamibacteria bacterium]|jgi:CheY-like chemotaxis protein
MKCPKCGASLAGTPDDGGFLTCPSCQARLRVRPAGSPPPASLDTILAEVRAVRRGQDEILSLLRGKAGALPREAGEEGPAPEGDEAPAAPPVIRKRRQKTVLLVDDQEETRQEAAAALDQARVPTRAFAAGPPAVEALAAERSDVIVLELAIGGAMAGKDFVNMVKATMEWVDIPIVLYTRVPVESQKEARTIHGADELVRKGPGSPEALVERVIQLFRRG